MAPDPLELAGTAVNTDTDTREVKPSDVGTADEGRCTYLPWPRAPLASSLLAGLRKQACMTRGVGAQGIGWGRGQPRKGAARDGVGIPSR